MGIDQEQEKGNVWKGTNVPVIIRRVAGRMNVTAQMENRRRAAQSSSKLKIDRARAPYELASGNQDDCKSREQTHQLPKRHQSSLLCLNRTPWIPHLQEDSSLRSNKAKHLLSMDDLPDHRPRVICCDLLSSGYAELLILLHQKGLTTKSQSHHLDEGKLG